jgi:uncharacterized membrane protein
MLVRSVFTPTFAAAIGSGLVAGVLFAFSSFVMPALTRWGQPGQLLILVASVLYIVGSAGVTMVCNVPLNDALAAAQAGSGEAAAVWTRYLKEWIFWNHLRSIASTTACALYIAAIAS